MKGKNTKPVIYCAKIKDKYYIGQTRDFYARKNRHISNAFSENVSKPLFHQMIEMFGKDAVEWTILEEFDQDVSRDILNEKEEYYIKKHNSLYPNGYNMTLGGHVNEEGYENMKKSGSRKGRKSPGYGKTGKDAYHRSPVINLTTGKKYDTIRQLCLDEYGTIDVAKYISRVCSLTSDRTQYKGCQYRYLDENGNPILKNREIPKQKSNIPIQLYDPETEIIYDSIGEFTRKTGISDRTVREKIHGITKTSKFDIVNRLEVWANGGTPDDDTN